MSRIKIEYFPWVLAVVFPACGAEIVSANGTPPAVKSVPVDTGKAEGSKVEETNAAAPSGKISVPLVGTYRNLSFNVDGAGGAQRNMAPLTIKADGAYQWSKEQGTWQLANGKLRLSERPAWGDAEINAEGQLIFAFNKDGKQFRVTMYRASD